MWNFRKTCWVVCMAAAQLAVVNTQAQAGPFLDWLLGRPIITYPSTPAPTVTANYAANACCPTTPAVPACGTPACAPVTAYQPVAQPVVPVEHARPLVVGYAPTYRSSWYRVPVTYYRPATAYPAVAGQPVTAMYPCNTYQYQVQRRPTLFHRPWLPAATPTTAYAPVVTQPVVPAAAAAPCACGGTHAVAPSTVVVPTVPTVGAPMATTTWPSTSVPALNSTVAPSPSDVPPTVIPGSSIPGSSIPGSAIVPADQAPSLQLNSAPSTYPEASTFPTNEPTSASVQKKTPNTASSVYQVSPIPDRDVRTEQNMPRVVAPPLLNTRDRTASQTSIAPRSVTQAVYKTPISPRTSASGETPIATSPAQNSAVPATQSTLWNDQGWRTAGSGK